MIVLDDRQQEFDILFDIRYEIELQPSGEAREYSLSANYELKKEEADLVDTMKFIAQVEGKRRCNCLCLWKLREPV